MPRFLVSSLQWVQQHLRIAAILLLIATATLASLVTLWSSVRAIQETLPVEHLMKERDFSALLLDVARMNQALEMYAANPSGALLERLQLSVDFLSLRARDNLGLHGANAPHIRQFHADLTQWVAQLDVQNNRAEQEGSSAAYAAVADFIRQQQPQWTDLRERTRILNDEVFQSSIESVNRQRDQLADLRIYLFVFVGLTALGAVALTVSLLQQQFANRRLQALGEEVRVLAFNDPLTGLANRRLLLERLQHFIETATRSGQYGALLYLDLDHFKSLNDTEGHEAGDELLEQVAQRLKASVRAGDTVGRFGGDEFVVMLEDLGIQVAEAATTAEHVAEKVRAALGQPFHLQRSAGTVWHRTVSVGVTVFTGEQQTWESVVRQADIALYDAKESGRDAIRFFDAAMQAAVQQQADLQAALRVALDKQQFVLHYQPVMDVQGQLCGAEALVRWQQDDNNLVPPAYFIAASEETGLIVPLGQWILQEACRQWVDWMRALGRSDLRLSVNVSGKQIRQADFVETVRSALEMSALPAHCLVVEVTESVVLSNMADTETKLRALQAMGVGIALDDFGTGYSSLTYVQRLPFSELKIDRSFVADIGVDPNDEAICAATVALARGLSLRIVVEGVETPLQRDFFRYTHACDFMQGYLFSKPLSAADFFPYARHALLGNLPSQAV